MRVDTGERYGQSLEACFVDRMCNGAFDVVGRGPPFGGEVDFEDTIGVEQGSVTGVSCWREVDEKDSKNEVGTISNIFFLRSWLPLLSPSLKASYSH